MRLVLLQLSFWTAFAFAEADKPDVLFCNVIFAEQRQTENIYQPVPIRLTISETLSCDPGTSCKADYPDFSQRPRDLIVYYDIKDFAIRRRVSLADNETFFYPMKITDFDAAIQDPRSDPVDFEATGRFSRLHEQFSYRLENRRLLWHVRLMQVITRYRLATTMRLLGWKQLYKDIQG